MYDVRKEGITCQMESVMYSVEKKYCLLSREGSSSVGHFSALCALLTKVLILIILLNEWGSCVERQEGRESTKKPMHSQPSQFRFTIADY
jgi:hypothetical protein